MMYCVNEADFGKIYFLDHEFAESSEDLIEAAETFDQFIGSIQNLDIEDIPKDPEMKVWVDPEFLKEIQKQQS